MSFKNMDPRLTAKLKLQLIKQKKIETLKKKQSVDNSNQSVDNNKQSVDNNKQSVDNNKQSVNNNKQSVDNNKQSVDNINQSINVMNFNKIINEEQDKVNRLIIENKQKTKEINYLEKKYKRQLDVSNHKNLVLEKQYKYDIQVLKNDIKNLKSQVQNLVEIMESILKIKN